MKVLIVDDSPVVIKRISANLSGVKSIRCLDVSDSQFALRMIDFGVAFDVALIDLRFGSGGDPVGHFDGLAICQKIRKSHEAVAIVGYSSSFASEGDGNRQFQQKFLDMGADVVQPLDYLTLTPAENLKASFQNLVHQRGRANRDDIRPRIFIGSSREQLEIARRIQSELTGEFNIAVWDQTDFGLGEVTIESLERATKKYDFAVFVFTPDDKLLSRNIESFVARDNVIFEAGLFIGSLTRERAFIVTPNGDRVKLPTDLHGVTVARFNIDSSNMQSELGPVCQRIRDAVRSAQRAEAR